MFCGGDKSKKRARHLTNSTMAHSNKSPTNFLECKKFKKNVTGKSLVIEGSQLEKAALQLARGKLCKDGEHLMGGLMATVGESL